MNNCFSCIHFNILLIGCGDPYIDVCCSKGAFDIQYGDDDAYNDVSLRRDIVKKSKGCTKYEGITFGED